MEIPRWRSRRDFTNRRFIEPVTAAIIAGGVIAGAGGGMLSAGAANRGKRKSRDFFDKRTQQAMNRLYGSFLGGQGNANFQDGSNLDPNAQAAFETQIGGPIFGQLKKAGQNAAFGFGENRRALDQLFAKQNELAFGAPGAIQGNFGDISNQINSLFGQAANPLESIIRGFGRGREDQIREDSALALKDLNQATAASTAGLGANTLQSVGQRGNAREVQRATDRSLTDLSGQQSSQLTSALSPFLFGGASGASNALMQGGQSSSNALMAAINRLFGQGVTSSQLGERNVGRKFALETDPLQQLLSLTQQPISNPFLGSGPIPSGGASGLGTALISTGNLATGLGGFGLANPGAFGGGGGGGGFNQAVPNPTGGFSTPGGG